MTQNHGVQSHRLSLRATRLLWGGLGAYTIVAALYQWLPPGFYGVPALAAGAAILSCGAIWVMRHSMSAAFDRLGGLLEAVPAGRWLLGCIALGLVLRLAVVLAFPFYLVSDPLVYWDIAQRLAAGGTFGSEDYDPSFWPPGLPLALTPFVFILGAGQWVAVLINLILFAATAWAAFHLAARAGGPGAARVAVLILAIWPNLVLMAGAPHKELLVAFLLPAAMLMYARASDTAAPRWGLLFCAGVCLGYAALTQPAATLFGFVFLGFEALRRDSLHLRAARLALVGVVAFMTVMPWTIRNYVVLGEFIPINTAGGMVFYSANNPHATGGWIDYGLFRDAELNEGDSVTQNRLAYRKAFEWIGANKPQFVRLMAIKQTRFLCCDSYGAFLLFDHPDLPDAAEPGSVAAAYAVSNGFWLLLAIVVLCGALLPKGLGAARLASVLLPLLAIYYFLAIFSVFQSEGKHHVNVAAFIAVVAACAVPSREEARRGPKRA